MAVSRTMVWFEMPSPAVPMAATAPCAVTSDTPMVISGNIIVMGLRYTMSRMASRPTIVAVSIRTRSRSPISWTSYSVPAGPVILACTSVLATAERTIAMTFLVASVDRGVAGSPTMLTGSNQALPSLLARISRNGGVLAKS